MVVEQLIIIGNGFDLHCELNTRFKNYFEETEPKSNEEQAKDFFNPNSLNPSAIHASYFENMSFWDIYFRLIKNIYSIKDWANVEEQLYLFLKYNKDNTIDKQSKFFYITNLYYILKYIPLDKAMKEYFEEMIKQKILSISDNDIDKCYFEFLLQKLSIYIYNKVNNIGKYKIPKYNSNSGLLINENKKFLYSFLYDELKIFENNLKNYIRKQVDKNRLIYSESYNKTLRKIAELKIQGTIDGNSQYNLISFNYTKSSFPSNCSNFINIHGDLDNDIIIGIDEKNISENDYDLYKFTKTYRLLELNNDSNTCLDKSIKFIKFYGHSLADADYSYFQSIFDFYDIYNNDVCLIFYYSNFDKKIDQRHITINSVVKLIKTYGNTLDNKDHGKNLLHKLELENRLLIKEL